MPFDADLIPQAVERYRRERDRYVKLADRVAEICREDVCEQNAIRAQVTFRAKTEKSFEGKLKRFSTAPDRNFQNVDQIFDEISDFAGIRISAYQEQDCEKIVDLLRRTFRGPGGGLDINVDRKDKKTLENENYYKAIHVQASLPPEELVGTYENLIDTSCEIQVCTMIAHVWNEIEHDIGYKSATGNPDGDEAHYLAQLGRLVRQGDLQITSLVAAHEKRIKDKFTKDDGASGDREFVDVHDFISSMRDFSAQSAARFSDNSGQLFEIIKSIRLNSIKLIKTATINFDQDSANKNINDFNNHLTSEKITDINVDPKTSDFLLIALLDHVPDKILDALKGRAGRGHGRPSRLHRIARRYTDWKNSALVSPP